MHVCKNTHKHTDLWRCRQYAWSGGLLLPIPCTDPPASHSAESNLSASLLPPQCPALQSQPAAPPLPSSKLLWISSLTCFPSGEKHQLSSSCHFPPPACLGFCKHGTKRCHLSESESKLVLPSLRSSGLLHFLSSCGFLDVLIQRHRQHHSKDLPIHRDRI